MFRISKSPEVAAPTRLTSGKHAALLSPFVVAVIIVIIGGYLLHWRWTGYLSTEKAQPPRTLWDWLTLLLQPLALAFVPVYIKLSGRKTSVWPRALLAGALVLAVLVVGGYTSGWAWTGFEGNTLWDWLGLFLVPFLLPLALVFLNTELDHKRRDVGASEGTEAAAPPEARAPTEHHGWSPMYTTAVAGCLVVLGFAGGWIAHISGTATTSSPTAGSASELGAVTVDAADTYWTNAHLKVRKGQRLDISAFGLARSSATHAAVGPGGELQAHPPRQSIVAAFPHLALLATVAPPGTEMPLRAQVQRERVVDVGQHRIFKAPASGELMLGVNDTGPDNNHGWFGATVAR